MAARHLIPSQEMFCDQKILIVEDNKDCRELLAFLVAI